MSEDEYEGFSEAYTLRTLKRRPRLVRMNEQQKARRLCMMFTTKVLMKINNFINGFKERGMNKHVAFIEEELKKSYSTRQLLLTLTNEQVMFILKHFVVDVLIYENLNHPRITRTNEAITQVKKKMRNAYMASLYRPAHVSKFDSIMTFLDKEVWE